MYGAVLLKQTAFFCLFGLTLFPILKNDLQDVEAHSFGMGMRLGHQDDAEILDDMVTRGRGEIRHIHSPKVTSTSSHDEPKLANSPRFADRAYSPYINEPRLEGSPRYGGVPTESTQTPRTPRTSTLGQSSHHKH